MRASVIGRVADKKCITSHAFARQSTTNGAARKEAALALGVIAPAEAGTSLLTDTFRQRRRRAPFRGRCARRRPHRRGHTGHRDARSGGSALLRASSAAARSWPPIDLNSAGFGERFSRSSFGSTTGRSVVSSPRVGDVVAIVTGRLPASPRGPVGASTFKPRFGLLSTQQP